MTKQQLTMTLRERQLLRTLAQQVAELAARPVEMEKRDLWLCHNASEPTRPVIFCDSENGWHEIIRPEQLECGNGLARDWEFRLASLDLLGDADVRRPRHHIASKCS